MGQRSGRRGRPRKIEARDVRGEILDAALGLFARQGYAATSIRQIADAVGVTNPALYAHFDSKQAVYDELMRQGGPPVATAVVDRLADADLAPRDLITAAVWAVWREWDTERQRRFLSVALREGLGGPADQAPRVVAAVGQVTDRLGPILDGWMAEGVARGQSVAGRHLAFELFGMVALIRILYLNEASTPPQRAHGRELVEQHLRFFLDALLPDDAPDVQARAVDAGTDHE
jgi:AcrR family transcriptional regulator